MLRIVSLLTLSTVACVPAEDYHSVSWTVGASITDCSEVSMTVSFESRTETLGPYKCTSSGGFSWTSDDLPLSVELTAFNVYVEECEGLSKLFCTTREAQDIVGHVESEIDLATETTRLVIVP